MSEKKKKHKCDLCSYRTAYTKSLINHIRNHTGEKPFECSVCGKSFSQINNCKRHEAKHTGEKPYECDVCQARFTEKGSLVKHMRFHTGDEQYKCMECNKVFSQSGHLKEHMRSHSEDKPFKCLLCEKGFKRKEGYKLHMLSYHNPGGKTYECCVCGQVFALPNYLKKHTRLRHAEKHHECLVCNKKFATNYILSVHSKTHTKNKNKKRSDFSECLGSKKKLIENEKQPPRKKFQCICHKNFSSKSAMKLHMKRKHPSFVEQSANSSCEIPCSINVSFKECEPVDHMLRDPLELNSYVKNDLKSGNTSRDENGAIVQESPLKISLHPNLCQTQEICSGDEISDKFEDVKIKEEHSFALEEQTYEQDMEQQMFEAEHNESYMVIKDNEFHTVYIKEELL